MRRGAGVAYLQVQRAVLGDLEHLGAVSRTVPETPGLVGAGGRLGDARRHTSRKPHDGLVGVQGAVPADLGEHQRIGDEQTLEVEVPAVGIDVHGGATSLGRVGILTDQIERHHGPPLRHRA